MSNRARQRAVNLFKRPDDEASTTLDARETARRAALAKSARLRAMRLARESGTEPDSKSDDTPARSSN